MYRCIMVCLVPKAGLLLDNRQRCTKEEADFLPVLLSCTEAEEEWEVSVLKKLKGKNYIKVATASTMAINTCMT